MIVIKVKPVKGKGKNSIQKNNVSKIIKTKSEVYASSVATLVSQLKKDALSGDVYPDVSKRIEAAARLLEEYESYTDKLSVLGERANAEITKWKEWRNNAVLVISMLNRENAQLRERIDELEDELW